MSRSSLKPRLIQLPDVLTYLGVKKPFFDQRLRSRLTEVKLGYRTIAFEKDEVDRLIDSIKKGETSCQTNCQQGYSIRTEDTKLTNDTNQPQATSLSEYKSLLGKPPKL
jgi:predicted DNA-binding transcriptional regulator AlpA